MIGAMMVLPVVESRKRDGAIQSRRLESGGPKTLGTRGRWWEISWVASYDSHGSCRQVGEQWQGCVFIARSGEPIP